jgi:hypothetical protein
MCVCATNATNDVDAAGTTRTRVTSAAWQGDALADGCLARDGRRVVAGVEGLERLIDWLIDQRRCAVSAGEVPRGLNPENPF